MEGYNVIEAKKSKNGIIIHKVDTGNGEPQIFKYDDIRGGLSWPTAASPAYYCILGEEYREIDKFEKSRRKGKLKLLAEHEVPGISLDDLFARLTDDTTLFSCSRIFTEIEEPYTGHVESFRDYCFRQDVKGAGYLDQAPYSDNFLLGLSWIEDWTKSERVDIPKESIVYSQLKSITKADLEDSPETDFHAINALRFVVGAFYKYRPNPNPPFKPNRRRTKI